MITLEIPKPESFILNIFFLFSQFFNGVDYILCKAKESPRFVTVHIHFFLFLFFRTIFVTKWVGVKRLIIDVMYYVNDPYGNLQKFRY